MARRTAILLALTGSVLSIGCASTPSASIAYLPALAGDYFQLASRATGTRYHVYVRLPEGYAAAAGRRYPTVYLLDGDSTFPMLAPQHLFLTMDDALPEAIIVGIAYGGFGEVNRRGFDFMPPGSERQAGAPAFQAMLKDELIPQIETRFRTDATRRILVGQSRGGSFVLYSAFTDPDLFWGRIASNPSIPPTPDFFNGTPAAATRKDLALVVVNGTRDLPRLRPQTQAWFAQWRGRSAAPWALHAIDLDGGTHAADLPNAYRLGLHALFDAPGADLLPKGEGDGSR